MGPQAALSSRAGQDHKPRSAVGTVQMSHWNWNNVPQDLAPLISIRLLLTGKPTLAELLARFSLLRPPFLLNGGEHSATL